MKSHRTPSFIPNDTPKELRPCVGIMLLNRDNKVFVAARIDNPESWWQMPQGGIDKAEPAYEAALRELEEETSVKPSDVAFLQESNQWLDYWLPKELQGKLWNGRWLGQRMRWFAFRLLADDHVINLATKHPEFREWQWVDPLTLPQLAISFKRPIYQSIVKEFNGLWQS